MTRVEHLLCILAEECVETAQRATKAQRFGLSEVQPGQSKDNAERIMYEFSHIIATLDMLLDEDYISSQINETAWIEEKKAQVEKYLKYSAACGTLEKE